MKPSPDYEPSCETAKARREYQHKPMSRARVHDIAIAFGLENGMPCEVKAASRGGWWLAVPAEYLEEILETTEFLEPLSDD